MNATTTQTKARLAVADEMRGLLAKSNKRPSDLARHMGLRPNTVSDRFTGKQPFDTDYFIAIADLTGTQFSELFTHLNIS